MSDRRRTSRLTSAINNNNTNTNTKSNGLGSVAPTVAAAPPQSRRLSRQQQVYSGDMVSNQDDSMPVPRSSSTGHHHHHHHHYRSTTAVNLPDDARYHHNHNHQHLAASGSSLNTIASDYRKPTILSSAGLQYQSTGMMSYHRHPYSSSQAQLQSLTGPSLCTGSSDTLRKTPNGQRAQQQQQQPSLKEYRSQLSLATTTTTKPMMTSMLNEPSPLASIISRQQTVGRTTFPNAAPPHPVQQTNANNGSGASHPLPPPYSVDGGSPMQQQVTSQVPMLNSSGVHQPQHHHQNQHVICHQPPSQFPCNVDNSNTSSSSLPPAVSSGQSGRLAQVSGPNSSSFPILQSTASQQMLNFLGSQALPASINFPPLIGQQQQHPAVLHHNQHHNQSQIHNNPAANETGQIAGSYCHYNHNINHLQQHHHQQQQPSHPSFVALSKSKSCLTCADISIKWYIVVIALLGLICALIGTIVGAVHSAGRDYISLALLIIGVGLVLVAISLIALRITIRTYKSNAARSPARARNPPPTLSSAHIARLFGPGNQPQVASNSSSASATQTGTNSSLHRSLLQERIYLMAAAAAAISRQQNAGQQQQEVQQPASASGQQPSGCQDPAAGGIMSSIKQRLPRRLARLIPLGGRSMPGSSRLLASSSSFRRHSTRNTTSAADLAAAMNSFTSDLHPLAASNPAALAAAHATLQQYQAGLLPGQLPAAAAAFLFPPPHLFAFPGSGSLEHSFRPPPPSYNASMQDYRLRMLLQERAGLQQMNSMIPSAHPPPPPPSSQASPAQAQSSTMTAPAAPEAASAAESSGDDNSVAGVGSQTSELAAADNPGHASTVVIESSAGTVAGVSRNLLTNQTASDDQLAAGGRLSADETLGALKLSSSDPSIGALVTNDIYVTSEDCAEQQEHPMSMGRRVRHLKQLEAPNRTMAGCQMNNSTIVNIGSSSIGPKPTTSNNEQQQPRSKSKSEAKILGYL